MFIKIIDQNSKEQSYYAEFIIFIDALINNQRRRLTNDMYSDLDYLTEFRQFTANYSVNGIIALETNNTKGKVPRFSWLKFALMVWKRGVLMKFIILLTFLSVLPPVIESTKPTRKERLILLFYRY